MIGHRINNRYEIQSELGVGGMGTVYKGTDTQTNQTVAIKQLKPDLIDSSNIERFKREGEALRELNHPNIVKMLDAIEQDGNHYLIMEYVSGGDLSETSNLPIKRILSIAIDLADALTRAHKLNIVHRDLKPANVLITNNGTLKLTDFGVARMQQSKRVTETGAAVGTLHYLSPESLDGKDVDTRADIWAFGVMLYEMLIGEHPFQGESLSSVVMAIMTKSVPDIEATRPDIPIELTDLIYRMLERDRDARIRSVRIVGAELEAIQEGYDFDVDSISTPAKPSASASRFKLSTDERLERPRHNLPVSPTPFVGRDDELKHASDLLGVRIFISYSRSDKQAMHDVVNLLNLAHPDYYVWYDENIPGGTDWWDYILSEIRNSDICIYLLSDDSLQSEFCYKEINEAMRLDKPILPVAVRGETDINFAPEDMRQYLEKTQHVTIVDVPTDTVTRQLKLSLDHILSTKDTKARLLTVMAPGGMGKTRFGLEVAERLLDNYTDGSFLVELAPLESVEQIIPAIAESLSFTFSAGQEPKQQLLDFLMDKSLLLIMDNFEHLIDGTGIVAEILKVASNIQIIATSRTKLNLHGETVYPLPGLEFPDWDVTEDAMQYSAVKLFMQSARRSRPGFELEADDLTHVARICRMMQGMPLGIELAAAWLSMLDLEEIADEISQSLDFLETEMTDIPERHRSIRAVFEYSWNLMDAKEQQIFMKLSVFRGGFTRKAAQVVAGANLRLLMGLVNKSLIHRDTDSGRFQVHELLRQYAEEKLRNQGQLESTYKDHYTYYLNWLVENEIAIRGGQVNEALEDMDNIRSAWNRAIIQKDVDAIFDAAFALFWIYESGYFGEESAQAFAQAAAMVKQQNIERGNVTLSLLLNFQSFFTHDDDLNGQLLSEGFSLLPPKTESIDVIRVKALYAFVVHTVMGLEEAEEYCQNLIVDCQEYDLQWEHAAAYAELSLLSERLGKGEDAITNAQHHLDIISQTGEKGSLCRALRLLGLRNARQGYHDVAQPLFEEALQLAEEKNYVWLLNRLNLDLLQVMRHRGKYEEGKEIAFKELTYARKSGHPEWIGRVLNMLAMFCSFLDEDELAKKYWKECLDVARKYRRYDGVAGALHNLGYLASKQNNVEEALGYFEESLANRKRTVWGAGVIEPGLYCNIAQCHILLGEPIKATQSILEALQAAATQRQPPGLLQSVAIVAEYHMSQGNNLQATEFLALVTEHPFISQELVEELDEDIVKVKTELEESVFSQAWERGKQLDLEETVQQLLAEFGDDDG